MPKLVPKIGASSEAVLEKSKRLEDRINVTFRIKKSASRDLKKICKDRETTASSVVEVLIEEFIKGIKNET